MRVSLALGVGLIVVVVPLGFVLADTERRQAGSNFVREDDAFGDPTLVLEGSGEHCERGQVVPKGAAALRLLVGTLGRPTPEVAVSVRAAGASISSGRLPAGGTEGHLVIPMQPVESTTPGAVVCIRAPKAGTRRTGLYGASGHVRLEWLREGSESWLELTPTLVHRFSLAKANPVGELLLPLTALVFLLGWAAALRIVVREMSL